MFLITQGQFIGIAILKKNHTHFFDTTFKKRFGRSLSHTLGSNEAPRSERLNDESRRDKLADKRRQTNYLNKWLAHQQPRPDIAFYKHNFLSQCAVSAVFKMSALIKNVHYDKRCR